MFWISRVFVEGADDMYAKLMLSPIDLIIELASE
jgi:hypothetical protein